MYASIARHAAELLLLCGLASPASVGIDEWTRIGPPIGNTCLAAAPSQPSTVYVLVSGELYKSINGGRTWGLISYLAGSEFTCDLRVDPAAPGTLYNLVANRFSRSTDGGATWTQATLPEPSLEVLALHPQRSGTIFLAGGDIAGRSTLLRSTDGGATWTALPVLPVGVETLAVAPGRPYTVYAGTGGQGVFKSTNGGGSWTPVNTGLDLAQGFTTIRAIAIQPGNPRTLLASTSKGMFRSTDGGGSWVSSNQGLGSRPIYDIAFDPARPSTVHAGTDDGVFKSTDGGVSWSPANQGLAGHEVLRVQVLPNALLAGTSANGVYRSQRSQDGAASWSPSSRGITGGTIVNLEIDSGSPQTGFAVDPRGGLYRHVQDEGWSLSLFPESGRIGPLVASRTPGGLAIDPLDPANVYVGLDEKIARSTDSGATWTVHSGLTCVGVEWIEIDPRQPSTLYAGGRLSSPCYGSATRLCLAWKSTDSGLTWTCLRETPRQHLSGLSFRFAEVNGFAISSQDSSLYAIVDGVLHRSTDGGISWPEISRLRAAVYDFEIDPGNPSILYAAGAGLFRSADRGQTWESLRLGVPPRTAPIIVALAIDPTRTTTLYALSGEGYVYRSGDSGGTWTRLPRGGGMDIEVDPLDPSTLYVGTYLRGVTTLTQSDRP